MSKRAYRLVPYHVRSPKKVTMATMVTTIGTVSVA